MNSSELKSDEVAKLKSEPIGYFCFSKVDQDESNVKVVVIMSLLVH